MLTELFCDVLYQFFDLLQVCAERQDELELHDDPVAAVIRQLLDLPERQGVHRATVMPKPHGTDCDPFHGAARIPNLDVFADPECVLGQKEYTRNDVADEGLGAKAEEPDPSRPRLPKWVRRSRQARLSRRGLRW